MASDPAPDAGSLHQAALTYLARYAATESGLRRVLLRRIDRWLRTQPDAELAAPAADAARAAVTDIVRRLAQAGAVSDDAFAESRARGLIRAGQSSRAARMKLIAKGVPAELARTVTEVDTETALASALVLARKRRIGPYRTVETDDPALRTREMGVLARAGFSRDIIEQALDTPAEDAEIRIADLRR